MNLSVVPEANGEAIAAKVTTSNGTSTSETREDESEDSILHSEYRDWHCVSDDSNAEVARLSWIEPNSNATPAVKAGLTDGVWSLEKLLTVAAAA